MKATHLAKRKCRKQKSITWGRKQKGERAMRYTFVNNGLFWIVTINSKNIENRNNIAAMLKSNRKKFSNWLANQVTCVGGFN